MELTSRIADGALADSGAREARFGTGSVRDTQEGKPRIDLIPPLTITRLGLHFANGAKKYGDNNWQKGQPLSQYYTSGMRHMLAWFSGEEDEDHFAAAMWNVQAAMWTLNEIEAGRLPDELDDRLNRQEAAREYAASIARLGD